MTHQQSPFGSHQSDVIVFGCVDDRLQDYAKKQIETKYGRFFFHFGVPGGAKALTGGDSQRYLEAIQLVTDKIPVSTIVVWTHLDCAGYSIADISKEERKQMEDLQKAKEFLKNKFPQIDVHAHMLSSPQNFIEV